MSQSVIAIHFEVTEDDRGLYSVETGYEGDKNVDLSFLLSIEEYAYRTPHEAAHQCLKKLDCYALQQALRSQNTRIFFVVSLELLMLANIYAREKNVN